MKRIGNIGRVGPAPALAGLVGLMLFSGSLTGSVVIQMELEQLVEESDTIIQGVVEAVYSQWDDERNLIFTHTSIRVDDPLKGDRTRSLLIRQMGGRVGSLNMTVAGMPDFEAGSNVIVFLTDAGNGTFHVTGLNQGRYVIVEDFAISNVSGVDLLNPKTGIVSGASTVRKVALEEFKEKIRELVR